MSNKIQERHFLEIKKSNIKNHTGFGWGNWGIGGEGIGIYMVGVLGYVCVGGNKYIYIYI